MSNESIKKTLTKVIQTELNNEKLKMNNKTIVFTQGSNLTPTQLGKLTY